MGGRGRGGGRGLSFTLDQLGISRGEALPAPVLTPPPHYPLLEHYPAIMEPGPLHYSMLARRTHLLDHFSRFSALLSSQPSSDTHLDFDWSRFPSELRPTAPKKRKNPTEIKAVKEKVVKVKNFDALLEELEKREEVIVKKELDEEEGGGGNEDEEIEDEEDEDEEMDEGTDYNQNYFDNGEGFLDEEDDGDDSPVY